MKKEFWVEHLEQDSGLTRPSNGGDRAAWNAAYNDHAKTGCLVCKAYQRTRKAAFNRRVREDAYRSAGLVKVRGAVSGKIYWE